MTFLTALWVPILISGVALFFASFVFWTMAPHHKTDWRKVDTEDDLMAAIGKLNLPAGSYMFPYCTHGEEMKSEAFQKKYQAGPRGVMLLWDVPSMGVNMFCTFLFFLVTAGIIAYVSYATLAPGERFLHVFRIVGTIGVLTYSAAGIPHGIWFKRRMITDIVDGIVYGILVGLIFAWWWPAA